MARLSQIVEEIASGLLRERIRNRNMNAEGGYFTHTGYMGYVSQAHEYRLFATESDYREYVASEQ